MLTFQSFQTSPIMELPDPDRPDHLHTGRTKAELIKNVVGYRSQNQLEPIENLGAVIDNYLCSLPVNAGKCRNMELKRGFLQYIKGGIALVKNVFYGEENMVDQDTADKRSAICKDCVFNAFPDRDTFVKWSDDLALHSVGERRSKYHDDCGNCMGCSCSLRAKVWYKGPFKLSEQEVYEMNLASKGKCWQIKE